MKIAIIGTVAVSRDIAPYADQEWAIWGCSPGNKAILPRVTEWFELHSVGDMQRPEHKAWSDPYFAWLRSQTFPVWMQEPNDLCSQAQVFPMQELVKEFGRNWFTSSIAWMMAFAMKRGATDIAIFGVDMAATEEHYSSQKAGCIRFIEIARSRGIKVHIPLESCVACPPPLYGYAESTYLGRKLVVRERELKERIAQMVQQKTNLEQEIAFFKGALEDAQYMRRTHVNGLDAELDLPAPVPDPVLARSPSSLILPPTARDIDSLSPEFVAFAKEAGAKTIEDTVVPVRKGRRGNGLAEAAG